MTPTSGADTEEKHVTVNAIDAPRNTDLAALVDMLQTQHAEKLDMVIPAANIRAHRGQLVVTGADVLVDERGVTDPNGAYDTTATLDEGISEKLGVPRQWLRKMHAERTDVWDYVINGLLEGGETVKDGEPMVVAPDDRMFLLRTFVSDTRRVARALLSNGYKIIDNLDILVAVLSGVKEAGVDVEITSDITDRRMYVRVVAPGVSVDATRVLQGYRSPFASPDIQRAGHAAQAYGGSDGHGNVTGLNPGLGIGNSETGDGGWTLTPRMQFPVCRNGLTVMADLIRGVHLGGKKGEGVVQWSQDTREKELAVITAKVRDAVQKFLHPDYVQATLDRIAEDMQVTVPADGVEKHVQAVAKKLAFDPETTAGVLGHFILGAQLTSGGVMQAVTSYAQTVSDADLAAELEEMALDVLGASATLARATH